MALAEARVGALPEFAPVHGPDKAGHQAFANKQHDYHCDEQVKS